MSVREVIGGALFAAVLAVLGVIGWQTKNLTESVSELSAASAGAPSGPASLPDKKADAEYPPPTAKSKTDPMTYAAVDLTKLAKNVARRPEESRGVGDLQEGASQYCQRPLQDAGKSQAQ